MDAKRILLVEDNPSDVELTRRALAKNNVANELVVARDGQEALDFLFATGAHAGRDTAVQPVIILLDLRLPKVDGLTVLKTLKGDERTRRIPVIVLTTSNEDRDLVAAYDLGVNSYIRKPVDFTEFVHAVNHLSIYWLAINEAPRPRRRDGVTEGTTGRVHGRAVERENGRCEPRRQRLEAAREFGIHKTTLLQRIRRRGLARPERTARSRRDGVR